MKLSKDDLQFIDNYLKNKGVIYLDIRYEMMDHIASAVETKMEEEQSNFYDAFKSYMVKNHQEFIKTNKKYLGIASRKATRILIMNLIKPTFMGSIALIFGLFYITTKLFPDFHYDVAFEFLNMVLILSLAGTFLYKHFTKGEKFSVADKLLGLYCVLSYFPNSIFRIQDKIQNLNLLFVYYAVMLGFALVTFFAYRELTKSYKNKYQAA